MEGQLLSYIKGEYRLVTDQCSKCYRFDNSLRHLLMAVRDITLVENRVQPVLPLSPGQSIVNIGGRKFLVIPRPQMELDSPPPSPPASAADRGDRGQRGEKLPILLEPADNSDNTPR